MTGAAFLALSMAQHGYVMETGRIVLDGPADRLLANDDIREFYLGIGGGEARRSFREVKHYPLGFPHADELDVGRADNPHLAFAQGPHYCLGAALARLEGHEAFEALVEALPELAVRGEPVFRPNPTFRGPTSLVLATSRDV